MIGNEISPIIHLRLETSRGSVNEDEELLEEIVTAVSYNFFAFIEIRFAQHTQGQPHYYFQFLPRLFFRNLVDGIFFLRLQLSFLVL